MPIPPPSPARFPVGGYALAAAAAVLCVGTPARAARVTAVAGALEDGRALDFDLDVGYVHRHEATRIARENLQLDPATGQRGIVLVDELAHQRTVDELQFRVAVGLWRDLEIHLLAPLALRDDQSWDYATVGGFSVGPVSTLANNRLDISGCSGPASACDPNGPAKPIVAVPGRTHRFGFRDPVVGVAWAPVNEARQVALHPDLFPPGKAVSTWVLGFDYTVPIPGDADDPFQATVPGGALPLGHVIRKAHELSLWTAFSKRYRVLDPYLKLRLTVPLAIRGASGAADNCRHPEILADVAPQNCVDPAWKNQTGYEPPPRFAVSLGSELVVSEGSGRGQKLAFDLRVDLTYFGRGRDYSQVSDALRKLTLVEQHLGLDGSLGFEGRLFRWASLRVAGTLGIVTPHFLTGESIGKDLDGDGSIDVSAGAAARSREQNPTYDFRLDPTGRRLRAELSVLWGASATLSMNF
ncbi:MAG: hypothetical protein NVS2B9_15540 [Myxococcales bacterium]